MFNLTTKTRYAASWSLRVFGAAFNRLNRPSLPQLYVIEHIESDVAAKLESSHALRQSILRHAFTGQLVPQDPNDEPASELLKRIAAERVKRAGQPGSKPKRAKRG